MKKTAWYVIAATLVSVAAVLWGTPAPAASKDTVKLAYVEWACATASTNLVKAVLEEKLHKKVEILPVSAAAMWQAVASGDVDGMVTAWLPVTHGNYLKKVKDKIVNLGVIIRGAKIGLVVPDYVTIDSIADLEGAKDKFNGKIIGIDPGAGIMSKTEAAIKDYGLKGYKLVEGSDATMTAALADAVKHKKWIVITGWTPHWMFGRFHLKYLKDPKGVFGGDETIDAIVRKGLKEDKPEVYAFLSKYKLSMSDLQALMAANKENGKPYENAKKFIAEHPKLVDSWL
ncbi:Substrate-binding region of ABC-type glycine betaine transport system [Solidesulfovibrio fructosivorans JJ]]|uniref:Substrate-binding region of ABC-type glycine betaine transport system n=1 Tax=Solidesulfovibrio fructosivorans JJ] TaxID=596151 RepID=E1JUP3_SOLFR|nr:glycine betaine ABC transporter substrate-binding protein [Solidesulfovibrio fructosivorans]EFL51807.1 Substrate-binding region of ABC-type glycine betaine transport system [Solidesulfovibrio fructosivorans JJ]]